MDRLGMDPFHNNALICTFYPLHILRKLWEDLEKKMLPGVNYLIFRVLNSTSDRYLKNEYLL